MPIVVTSIYTSILALFILGLALNVVKQRRRLRVGLGDNGDSELQKSIRTHGNTLEYVPLALFLMLIFELNGGDVWVLHFWGSTLVLGRVLHFLGLSKHSGRSFGRFYGTLLTWIVIIGLSLMNLFKVIFP